MKSGGFLFGILYKSELSVENDEQKDTETPKSFYLLLRADFCSINTDEEYCFQGSEADDVIKHIADIWNTSEITQDEAISQWISMHL